MTATPVTFAWTGTADASTSTRSENAVLKRTNRALDPEGVRSMVKTTAANIGWSAQWFGNAGTGTNTFLTGQVDGPAGLGIAKYTRKTWTATPTTAGDIGWSHTCDLSITGTNLLNVPVSAGASITISAYVRSNLTGGVGASMKIFWRDTSGNYLSATSGTVTSIPTKDNTWRRLSLSAVAPAGAGYAGFETYINMNPVSGPFPQAGDTLDGTGLLVEFNSVLGDWFDGRTTGFSYTAVLRLMGMLASSPAAKLRLMRLAATISQAISLAPIANRTVEPMSTVSTAAVVTSGTATGWTWRQISGPTVTLTGSGATRSFVAPATSGGTTVVLGVQATGIGGSVSTEQTVTVLILPHTLWVLDGGAWKPLRVTRT